MKAKALILAVVMGALLILCSGIWFVFNGPAPRVPVPLFSKPAVATSTITEETPAYVIHADYPQFGIPSIDAQLTTDIQDVLTEFKALPQNPHDSAVPQNSFTGLFEDPYIGDDVVSVKLILSQYTGGAHPMTIVSGVTYDRSTGKRMDINKVLPLIGKTLADISKESSDTFKEKFGEGFFSEGATSNPENFSSFVVTKDAVTFIFQQYQVAAYVNGPQEMSFKRVK